jgi:hypothetical protein
MRAAVFSYNGLAQEGSIDDRPLLVRYRRGVA